jgi:hypothetical protein
MSSSKARDIPAEIKIDKVVLKIGKKELELSLEEAKELMGILDAAFGREKVGYSFFPTTPWRWQPVTYPRWTVYSESGNYTSGTITTTDNTTMYCVTN